MVTSRSCLFDRQDEALAPFVGLGDGADSKDASALDQALAGGDVAASGQNDAEAGKARRRRADDLRRT
jgi:hypothetical protein